jgi:hypothetical protein
MQRKRLAADLHVSCGRIQRFSGLDLKLRVGTSRNSERCVCCASHGMSVAERRNTTVAKG